MKSMDPRSVKLVIEFAYTAQIRITEENVYVQSFLLPAVQYNFGPKQEPIKLEVLKRLWPTVPISPVNKACCDFFLVGIRSFLKLTQCFVVIQYSLLV